jgi:hypothetical protein
MIIELRSSDGKLRIINLSQVKYAEVINGSPERPDGFEVIAYFEPRWEIKLKGENAARFWETMARKR